MDNNRRCYVYLHWLIWKRQLMQYLILYHRRFQYCKQQLSPIYSIEKKKSIHVDCRLQILSTIFCHYHQSVNRARLWCSTKLISIKIYTRILHVVNKSALMWSLHSEHAWLNLQFICWHIHFDSNENANMRFHIGAHLKFNNRRNLKLSRAITRMERHAHYNLVART